MLDLVREGLKTYCIGSSGYSDYFYSVEYPILRYNKISVLVPVQLREKDGAFGIYYDVTGKQSLVAYSNEQVFSETQCRNIIKELVRLMETLDEYLLETEYICYDPDYIFMSGKKLFWLYGMSSGRPIQEDLDDFLSFLLSKVDYNDPRAVDFVYQIFWTVRKQGFSVELIKDLLQSEGRDSEGISGSQYSLNINQEAAADRYEEFFSEHQSDMPEEGEAGYDYDEKSDQVNSLMSDRTDGHNKGIACLRAVLSIGVFLIILALLTAGTVLIYFGYQRGITDRGVLVAAACFLSAALLSAGGFLFYRNQNISSKTTAMTDNWNLQPKEKKDSGESDAKTRGDKIEEYRDLKDFPRREEKPLKIPDYPANDEGTVILSRGRRNCPLLKSLEYGEFTMIKEFPFYIGSDPVLNQMVLIDQTISRQHAVILRGRKKNSYLIKDLGSTNGTWVQGLSVGADQPCQLEEGSIICFAQKKYRFMINRDNY